MGMYVAYILIFFVYILCRKGNNYTRIAPLFMLNRDWCLQKDLEASPFLFPPYSFLPRYVL